MRGEPVIIYGSRRGEIVEEGAQQSTVRVLEGRLQGQVICLPNQHFKKMRDRKSSGPADQREYPRGRGGKTKEAQMSNEDVGTAPPADVDYVARYNELVEEAVGIGLTAKKISTRFRDAETGAKRCEALAGAIKTQREKMEAGEVEAAPPAAEETSTEEEAPPAKTRKRSKKVAKSATAKKAAKKAPAKKAAKTAAPRTEKVQRNGVVGEFGTREGSFREGVLLALHSKKNKPVLLSEVAKEVYGKKDDEARLKVKAVIVGLNLMIDGQNPSGKKLPYEPVKYEGRGEEATVTLSTKSGR